MNSSYLSPITYCTLNVDSVQVACDSGNKYLRLFSYEFFQVLCLPASALFKKLCLTVSFPSVCHRFNDLGPLNI